MNEFRVLRAAAGAPPAILATGLRKSFGDHVVLDGIDLNIAAGTVFALLGPNGSGKTTTVQILSTLLPADAGTVRVAGHDLDTEPELVRAAAGVFALLTLALTWLTVAFGLLAKTPAGANSLALLPAILPFVSSAFIPAGAMSGGVRWFATNEPFTPVIDTLRGLLTGAGIGDRAVLAVAWCAGLSLAGYLWARVLYNRGPAARAAGRARP